MTKRRTRKQKETAKRTGYITWDPNQSSGTKTKSVKREKMKRKTPSSSRSSNSKNSVDMVKDASLGSTKRDIAKTLAITSFILGLELVLYWALQG